MAEGGDQERSSEDLGDEISQHRLEEYRKKGMVAQSREVSGLIGLLAAATATWSLSPSMGKQLAEFMRDVFTADLSARVDLGSTQIAHTFLMKSLHLLIVIGLPICLAGFLLSVVGSFMQIGSIWSFEPLQPDFGKINPLSGFKRVFSMKQGWDGIRLVIKATVAGMIAYGLVKSEVLGAHQYTAMDPVAILGSIGHVSKVAFLSLFIVLAAFAVIDFAMQKFEFNKQLRLTKQEAKQEHKERDGDPQIKARIRAVQREIARRRMMQNVKKATVIITNPTHIAIAILYEKDGMGAPKVVAKGADFMAQRIKKIASEAGVPLVENVPLARTLFKTVKVGHPVPRALYQAVAEVLALRLSVARG